MKFDVDKALTAWERNYPEKGERVVVLRGMLYDCESQKKMRRRGNTVTVSYPETARNLRLMLAAEGSPEGAEV